MGDCHRSWLPLEVDGETLSLKPPHVSLEGREESSEDLAGGVLLTGIAFTVPEGAMQAARGELSPTVLLSCRPRVLYRQPARHDTHTGGTGAQVLGSRFKAFSTGENSFLLLL